jgi:Fur family iron response transcriptional regulator
LHAEVDKAGIDVSLATVYNTLHQFTEAGILRHVSVDASRFYFDTNIDPHQHFYDQATGTLIDIPGDAITIADLPNPPKDTVIDGVNVVIRIRPAAQHMPSAGIGHVSVK